MLDPRRRNLEILIVVEINKIPSTPLQQNIISNFLNEFINKIKMT
jgi:hypothetical protein